MVIAPILCHCVDASSNNSGTDVEKIPDDFGLSDTLGLFDDQEGVIDRDQPVELESDKLSSSRRKLIESQEQDPELDELRKKALDDCEIGFLSGTTSKDGVLMRKFRPPVDCGESSGSA